MENIKIDNNKITKKEDIKIQTKQSATYSLDKTTLKDFNKVCRKLRIKKSEVVEEMMKQFVSANEDQLTFSFEK